MKPKINNNKVVLGMSGGVDSSVAAVLLKEQGYQVIGVHMKYWSEKDEVNICDNGIVNNDPSRANACCSLDSLEDARRVCAKLDIPLYVVDFKDKFKQKIVDLFISELKSGFTPNACVACNRDIKFGLLLDYALSIGADKVATGHYAQVFYDNNYSRYGIKRAADLHKDQSYFLALLSQRQLSKIILPLGGLRKEVVREIAQQNELINAKRRDSQDLCFISNDYKSFVKKYADPKIGAIIFRPSGEVIGSHEGLVFYTLGQRKGINSKFNIPLYVYDKDFNKNELIVDTVINTDNMGIVLKGFNNLSIENFIFLPNLDFVGRYQGESIRIDNLNFDSENLNIAFSNNNKKFANGQYGAIYQNDVLLGAGKIVSF